MTTKKQDPSLASIQATLDIVVQKLGEHDQKFASIDAKLDEHGRKLDEHGRKLDEHGRKLDEHGRKLDEHSKKFAEHDARFDCLEIQNEKTHKKLEQLDWKIDKLHDAVQGSRVDILDHERRLRVAEDR